MMHRKVLVGYITSAKIKARRAPVAVAAPRAAPALVSAWARALTLRPRAAQTVPQLDAAFAYFAQLGEQPVDAAALEARWRAAACGALRWR